MSFVKQTEHAPRTSARTFYNSCAAQELNAALLGIKNLEYVQSFLKAVIWTIKSDELLTHVNGDDCRDAHFLTTCGIWLSATEKAETPAPTSNQKLNLWNFSNRYSVYGNPGEAQTLLFRARFLLMASSWTFSVPLIKKARTKHSNWAVHAACRVI